MSGRILVGGVPVVTEAARRRRGRGRRAFVNDYVVRVGRNPHELLRFRLGRMTVTIAVSVSIAVTHRPEFGATGSRENPGRRFMRFNLWGPWQNVESLGDLLNDGAADHRVTLGEAVQHRVIADVVNRARNSRRAAEDVVNRAGRKDLAISAGDFQTRLDVLAGFLDRRQ